MGTFLLYVQSPSDDLWKECIATYTSLPPKLELVEDGPGELFHILGGLEEVVRILGAQLLRGRLP